MKRKIILLVLLAACITLVSGGCAISEKQQRFARSPVTGEPLIHFSQYADNACGAACIRMMQLYQGCQVWPEDQIMQYASIYGGNGLAFEEIQQFLSFYSFINTQMYYTPYAGGFSANDLMTACANHTLAGRTPIVGVYWSHYVMIGGYAYETTYGERTDFIIYDPAIPDTAREKIYMTEKSKFAQRVDHEYIPSMGQDCYMMLAQGMPFNKVLPLPAERPANIHFRPSEILQDGNPIILSKNWPGDEYEYAYHLVHSDYEAPQLSIIDTVRAFADSAMWRAAGSNLQSQALRYGDLLASGHWGAIYPTSYVNWEPPAAKDAAGREYYMWVCEFMSNSNNELVGAALVHYGPKGKPDSLLNFVFVPVRPGSASLAKVTGVQTWKSAVSLSDLKAEYDKVEFIHTNQPMTISSMPDLDLPLIQVTDKEGNKILMDRFGDIMELDQTGYLAMSNKRWSPSIDRPSLPAGYELYQNYPNPFNPTTDIAFSLPTASHCVVEIINTLGQRVKTVVDADMAAGYHCTNWDGTSDDGSKVASGVYFYRLTTNGGFVATRKMLLMK